MSTGPIAPGTGAHATAQIPPAFSHTRESSLKVSHMFSAIVMTFFEMGAHSRIDDRSRGMPSVHPFRNQFSYHSASAQASVLLGAYLKFTE